MNIIKRILIDKSNEIYFKSNIIFFSTPVMFGIDFDINHELMFIIGENW